MKQFFLAWYAAFLEALYCILLGIRASFSNGLWWRSALWCSVVLLFWLWFYYYFAKEIAIVVGIISFVATYGAIVLGFLPTGAAASGSVAGMGGIGAGLVQLVLYTLMLAVAIYVFFFAFMVLTIIRLPLNPMFMDRSADAVARYYGNAPVEAYPHNQVKISIVKTCLRYGLLLIGLTIPILSGYLLLLIALYINVRLLYPSAVKRVYAAIPGRLPLHEHFRPLLMLGTLALIIVFIPGLNLLLPAVLCTSILHLVRRGDHWKEKNFIVPNLSNSLLVRP